MSVTAEQLASGKAATEAAPVLDHGGRVRAGEELDAAAVSTWLRERIPGLSGAPEVTQYAGGASNWTYRLAYPAHDLILRRAPAGTKAAGAHDMGREFRIQQALAPHYPVVPKVYAHCTDASIIGAEFYVMQRLRGLIPRRNLPRGVDWNPARVRRLCTHVIDRLVDLHRVDVQAAGLSEFGRGEGYVQRQIEGWSERYARARTWNVPRFGSVTRWLAANMPADSAACLIHNDYRFDNVVLDADEPDRVLGILDWEMATVGDPLMDLGNTLAYWVQADDDAFIRGIRRQPTHVPGMLTRREVIDYYAQASGREIGDFRFYLVYGQFRLAAIVQQIYYRYHHGQTRNPAFRHFWLLAHYLNHRCKRLIRNGRI